MKTSLGDLARLVGGELQGDANLSITGANPPEDAISSEITLVDRVERIGKLTGCAACAVVVPPEVTVTDRPTIVVANAQKAFAKIVQHLRGVRTAERIGVSHAAIVSPTAKIGQGVDIHRGVVVGEDVEIGDRATIHSGVQLMAGCRVGADTVIYPGVVLYENTKIGDRCAIHAGSVLGAFGFGYEVVNGRHMPAPQLGNVEVADDVEIGANVTIDRGTYGPTKIGEGTKIDNQVMIAHNCRIGKHNIICSQVGIAGSSTTGDYVVIAGQVGVRDHIHIGSFAMLGAKSGVSNDVGEGVSMLGIPAAPLREQKVRFAAIAKLPDMRREMRDLIRKVEALEAEINRQSGRAAA